MTPTRKGIKSIVVLLAVTMLASACGSSSSTSGSQSASGGTSKQSSSSSSNSSSSSSSQKLIPLSIGYPAPSGSFTPLYIAKQEGIFKKNGLNVKLSKLSGSGSEVAALKSGGIQLVVIDASSALPALAKGIKGVFVGAGVVHPIFVVYAKPSIKTVKGLEGHTLGLEHVNGGADVTTREFLPKAGVNLSKVNIKYIGNPANTTAALIAGKVDAAVTLAPPSIPLKSKGFKLLYDFRKVPHVANGFLAMKAYANSHGQAVKDFLKSWAEATNFMRNPKNKAKSEADISTYTKIQGKSALAGTLSYYSAITECVPNLPSSDLQDSVQWTKNHYHENVNVKNILDLTYLNQVKSSIKSQWCSGS